MAAAAAPVAWKHNVVLKYHHIISVTVIILNLMLFSQSIIALVAISDIPDESKGTGWAHAKTATIALLILSTLMWLGSAFYIYYYH